MEVINFPYLLRRIIILVGKEIGIRKDEIMNKLYRSNKNWMIAGICGGAGEVYSIDPKLLRLVYVFIYLVTGIFPLLITYLIAWIVIPLSVESWGIIRCLDVIHFLFPCFLLRKEYLIKEVKKICLSLDYSQEVRVSLKWLLLTGLLTWRNSMLYPKQTIYW